MTNDKFDKKYQYIYNQTKDTYKTKGYGIDWIDEIYLPFWVCKQEIYIQTVVKPDEFTKILMELIDNNLKSRTEICSFLGVNKDDFTLSQLDYLIRNEYIEENFSEENSPYYEITHEGRNFIEEKNNEDTKIETTEIDYIIPEIEHITEEKYETFFNDLNQEFFNKNELIDSDSNHEFSGYKAIESHKLKKDGQFPPNHIKHGDKPTINKLKNSNFIDFFNKNSEYYFYDFNENKSIEAHKRSIQFYLIYYENEDREFIAEVRHCPETVKKYDKKRPCLEEKLSKPVTKYIRQNRDFINNIKEYRQKRSK